ncbi:hypothetical protein R1T08_01750 [Streptomyces sp. SBC-4]|nr:hypothetical protein [Streptomyces sp. SBC-4]MDV5143075.1 hypothetical protein [Streptomyces sp. SBC-4]
MVRFTPNDPTGTAVNTGSGSGQASFTVNPAGALVRCFSADIVYSVDYV